MKDLLLFVSFLLLLSSCSVENQMVKMKAEADAAREAGNEVMALERYDALIVKYEEQGRQAECPVYDEAGLIALNLGQDQKGIGYLEKAVDNDQAGEAEYIALANAYHRIDNLSKEIGALEDYLRKFPHGSEASALRKRLFQTYVESENWEQAYGLWPQLKTEGVNDLSMLEGYFKVTRALDQVEASDEVAYRIQDLDPENVEMMEYFAKKYYWLAENRYQEEMAAYEANKTNKQYNQLVRALDVVTRHFKLSLSYFDRLFRMQPSPEYAQYLANIYARLDDEEQAEYFREMIK